MTENREGDIAVMINKIMEKYAHKYSHLLEINLINIKYMVIRLKGLSLAST